MTNADLPAEVAEAVAVDRQAFQERVEEETEGLKAALREGVFDNPQANVGFEYEFYGVEEPETSARAPERTDGSEDGASLVRLPRVLLRLIGFEKELGLHNAEMNTSPQPLSAYGLTAQEAEVQARLAAALEKTRPEGIRLVSDGMWTIPPTGETAPSYLTESVTIDGIRIAVNMSESVRYHAMANTELPIGMCIEAPHVTLEADTVMPESLITSIQPHYQVPHAPDLPAYFQYALRIAGPLLALGANSPFFPPELYDDGVEPATILEDAHLEHRIDVFESTLNPEDEPPKVTFPPDVGTVEEAVDLVAADHTVVPMDVAKRGRYDDRFRHFTHKHGSFWRWARPVFEGASRSSAHARIEFRPIPGQPTVRDSIAFLAAYAGLLEECYAAGHPVRELPWSTAESNFYGAAQDGLAADLTWITADGERTSDVDALFDDLIDAARRGLERRGLEPAGAERYLGPLRARVTDRRAPADWKIDRVRDRLDDGADLAGAITGMQREYVARQAETLIEGTFADWP